MLQALRAETSVTDDFTMATDATVAQGEDFVRGKEKGSTALHVL